MNSLIIEYDLVSPGQNYSNLHDAIKSYPGWAHITESTWFIKTNDSCSQVRDKLMVHMDKNDRLFVAQLTGTAAWHKVLCNNEYLKKQL